MSTLLDHPINVNISIYNHRGDLFITTDITITKNVQFFEHNNHALPKVLATLLLTVLRAYGTRQWDVETRAKHSFEWNTVINIRLFAKELAKHSFSPELSLN